MSDCPETPLNGREPVPLRELAIPHDAQGPVFAEPWQGQVFAMAVLLHERGLFSWTEWAATLSEVIRAAQLQGDPDRGDTYYEHWCTALERLLREKGVAEPLALASLRQAWRIAAETTPHGQPIQLRRAARALAQSPTSFGPS